MYQTIDIFVIILHRIDMLFEKQSQNRRKVTFEIDQKSKIHEQVVAMNALGLLTALRRHNPADRLIPAELGVKIGQLKMTTPEEPEKPVPTSMLLSTSSASTLGSALRAYSDDTPADISKKFMFEPYSACIRALESAIASTMLERLSEEYGLVAIQRNNNFGYR